MSNQDRNQDAVNIPVIPCTVLVKLSGHDHTDGKLYHPNTIDWEDALNVIKASCPTCAKFAEAFDAGLATGRTDGYHDGYYDARTGFGDDSDTDDL